MQKTDFMNAISRFEYTVTMMCRENFINVETDFINAKKKKKDSIIVKFKHEKAFRFGLAFKFRKHDFTRCFMRKRRTIF